MTAVAFVPGKRFALPMRIGGALLGLCLASCSDSQRFSFAGAGGDFCVPNDYVVDGRIWLTREIVADNGGFAWRGCGNAYKGQCDIPAGVEGGTVSPRSTLRSHQWGDFRPGTTPWETTRRALANHTYRIMTDAPASTSRILVTPTEESPAGVFYWRIPATGEAALEASTPLLAECDGVNPKLSPDAAEVAFHCVRVADAGNFALRYSFTSGAVNSALIVDLDQRVAEGVNRWRCPKK